MSSGASGSDEKISASKIEPLDSETKYNQPHVQGSRGVVGTDRTIDQARTEPLGGAGQYQHTAPHADDEGVVGKDSVVQASKIEPLNEEVQQSVEHKDGLGDEAVDTSRIEPIGSVREEIQ